MVRGSASASRHGADGDHAILEALARHEKLLKSTKGELTSEIRSMVAPPGGEKMQHEEEEEEAAAHRVTKQQEDLVQELEKTAARVCCQLLFNQSSHCLKLSGRIIHKHWKCSQLHILPGEMTE